MPKTGLGTHNWHKRLLDYAEHKFNFGRGERPPKNSVWSHILEKIENCPRQKSKSAANLFGQPIVCNCGYHKVHIITIFKIMLIPIYLYYITLI